jgi:hypothetical protein
METLTGCVVIRVLFSNLEQSFFDNTIPLFLLISLVHNIAYRQSFQGRKASDFVSPFEATTLANLRAIIDGPMRCQFLVSPSQQNLATLSVVWRNERQDMKKKGLAGRGILTQSMVQLVPQHYGLTARLLQQVQLC